MHPRRLFRKRLGEAEATAQRRSCQLRAKSFTIDGEAAVCGPDGIAVFDALHRRGTLTEAMLFAFDLLVIYCGSILDKGVHLTHIVTAMTMVASSNVGSATPDVRDIDLGQRTDIVASLQRYRARGAGPT
jgi:hypothetical protein